MGMLSCWDIFQWMSEWKEIYMYSNQLTFWNLYIREGSILIVWRNVVQEVGRNQLLVVLSNAGIVVVELDRERNCLTRVYGVVLSHNIERIQTAAGMVGTRGRRDDRHG